MRYRDLPSDRSSGPSPDDSLDGHISPVGGRDVPPGADGRARPADELLDNLRLRLRDLPRNHPSALRDPDPCAPRDVNAAPRDVPAAPPRDVHAAPREVDGARGERAQPAEAGGAEPREDEAASGDSGADAQGRGGGAGSVAELIRAITDASGGLPWPADGFLAGEMDLFAGSGGGEAYRPWFMSGEPGVPWFVDGDDV